MQFRLNCLGDALIEWQTGKEEGRKKISITTYSTLIPRHASGTFPLPSTSANAQHPR